MTAVSFDPFSRAPDVPRPDDTVAQLVVVCHANICRSPLAMAMLESEAWRRRGAEAEVWVRSAGVRARDGLPAAEDTRWQADERGLDLGAHRSARLERRDVADADLVVTMTESQRDDAVRLHPPSTGWTFTLPELARLAEHVDVDALAGLGTRDRVREAVRRAAAARPRVPRPATPEDVDDPHGGPREGYAVMGDRVAGLVADVAALLFGEPGIATDPR